MHIPDYSDYGFEDFLMDADFRAWVMTPTPDSDAFWQRFIAAHPELNYTIEKAAWAIQHLTVQPYRLSTDSQDRIWQQLERTYDQLHPAPAADEAIVRPLPVWQRGLLRPVWGRVAASLVVVGGLLVFGVAWYVGNRSDRQVIETSFTETKRVTLPDGSEVTLNRNSSLSYDGNWHDPNQIREVWVSGEAFFSVHRNAAPGTTQARKPADAFVVHTDLMTVEVLGTQFDVNTRRGKTRVVLNEGKVKLTRQREGVEESMLMKPGDLVDVTPVSAGFARRQVKPSNYDAWKSGQLHFDKTPVADIINVLEDTYGWQVTLKKPSLAKQTFSATVPADKPDLLLALLTESFGLHIHRRGQAVTID